MLNRKRLVNYKTKFITTFANSTVTFDPENEGLEDEEEEEDEIDDQQRIQWP